MVEGESSLRLPYHLYTGPVAYIPYKINEANCSLRKVNKKKYELGWNASVGGVVVQTGGLSLHLAHMKSWARCHILVISRLRTQEGRILDLLASQSSRISFRFTLILFEKVR